MNRCKFGCIAVATILFVRPAFAQATREGRLIVTVVDQSNAVLPGATVTAMGSEDATAKVTLAPVQTQTNGIATVPAVPPGRYNIQAEFPGFDSGVLKDVRVRAGDNRHVVILPIQKFQETVAVGQDVQASAADRRGAQFGTSLTREQMDALSDDPNEMQRQLEEMAGPGAVIRIDSFEGGQLPPKAMIKAIHITRDQFAAENHGSEGTFIDIITQPGVGPIRTNLNYNLSNTALSARNAFSPIEGASQNQNFFMGINGGLIRNKASFAIGFSGQTSFDTPSLNIARPSGTSTALLNARMPRQAIFPRAGFDWAVTRDQTLRLTYNESSTTNKNLGIGGYNELERASTSEFHSHTFRVQEAGPIGRRFFTNTRLNVGWTDAESRSAVEARTIRVLDAFTSGGAQVGGGRHSKDMTLASDLDYVRGIHSLRAGTVLNGQSYRSNDTSNYLGTYTFESLPAYEAGLPRSYNQRIGDPNITYFNLEAGFYVQDDIRVRRGLTLTPGVRYEAQTHVKDYNNWGPRFGVTWAPFKNGKTTLRTSWGIFYDWLSTNTYEQTLRVDGFRQRELNIMNPSYPDPSGDITSITPVNRYLLDPALQNAKNSRISGGADYAITQRMRASVTYRYVRGIGVLRGQNLNGPINGIRPDPNFGNIVEVVSDGRSRQHVLQFTAQTPPPPSSVGEGKLWDWKRFGYFSGYTYAVNNNNADGPFATPAAGLLSADWGPAPNSIRHTAQAGYSSSTLRNLTWQFDGRFATGVPYNIQTGLDDNGDLIFNDRPAGIGRNGARAKATWSTNLFVSYSFTFGPRIVMPGGPMIYGTPAGISMTTFTPPPQGRYRITLNCFIYNVTNHVNLGGYSGTMTSPFFRQPTMAQQARRINVGLGLGF
jgi:hypothetical protein